MIDIDDRSRRRSFGVLFVVLVTVSAGNTALTAVLPAIGRELEMSDTAVAAVFSLSALLWAVSAPYWARMSDRRGRKPLIVMGLAGYAVSMTLFGLVVLAGLMDLIGWLAVFMGLMLTRSLFGLAGSATNPASQAYVADRTTAEQRTPSLTILASAIGLGTVLGPAVAPFFALPPIGLSGPIFAFALIAAAVLVLVLRLLPETPQDVVQARGDDGEPPPSRKLWRDPRLLPFLIYCFVMVSVQAVNIQALGFLVIDTVELPPARAQTFIGAAMMAGAAAGLMAQWGLIRLLHMSPRSLLRWGAGCALLGNGLLAVAPDFGTVVFAYGLASLGFGFARPGFTAGASLGVTAAEQGAVAGLLTAVIGAAFIVAPVAGMALYEWWRPGPFLANAWIMLALLAYTVRVRALKSAGRTAQPPESVNLLRG